MPAVSDSVEQAAYPGNSPGSRALVTPWQDQPLQHVPVLYKYAHPMLTAASEARCALPSQERKKGKQLY